MLVALFGQSLGSVPFDQFLLPSRRRRRRHPSSPLPLFLSLPARRRCPGAPRPDQPGSSARRCRVGEEAKENPGDRNSGRERAERRGRKLRTAGGKLSGGGVLCRPRRRFAARVSFPFPRSGPRASDCTSRGRGRGLPAPRGEEQSHLWLTLGGPESPCPETQTRRLRAPSAQGYS